MMLKRIFRSVWIALALLPAACGPQDGPPPEAEAEDSHGRLVVIGGGLQAENHEVYQAILDGRDGDGPICVFPTASSEPEGSMESAVSRIDAVGGQGTAVGVLISEDNPEAAASPEVVATIQGCSGFYFSGGSQSRIVRAFRPEEGDSPAYQAVMERFRAGAVVSGSSAGAAIMNDPMIAGGNSEEALAVGITWEPGTDGVRLARGMGYLEGTLVDQHFLARGRWARLLVAVLGHDAYAFGAGIDENTAIVVDGNSARVVGASGVVLFDLSEAVPLVRADSQEDAGASQVRVTFLGAGDRVDLERGAVEFSSDKTALEGTDTPAVEMDLFEDWGLLHFFGESAQSSQAVFEFTQEGYDFRFEKGPGFQALASGMGAGVEGEPPGLAAGPYLLRFTPQGEG